LGQEVQLLYKLSTEFKKLPLPKRHIFKKEFIAKCIGNIFLRTAGQNAMLFGMKNPLNKDIQV